MRILVTGSKGQVASALAECARQRTSIALLALGRPALNLERPSDAEAAVITARPDLIVNAAAYTAVDKAESEPERALAINRDGSAAVARAAASLKVPLIHISTDYVFDGTKPAPYVEADPMQPLGVYGRSKRDGEEAVFSACPSTLILRTSWVFSPFGTNFVKTMLRLGTEREVLRVVDDQFGNPTSALDLADAILNFAPQLVANPQPGSIYHFANTGSTTWHGFADAIFTESEKFGKPRPRLEAITTADYPTPARRPQNSRLDTSAFTRRFGITPRAWQVALGDTVSLLYNAERL